MVTVRRCLIILSVLVFAANSGFAASSAEDHAYTEATKAFQDHMWERAQTKFAQFVEKYPKSARVPEAVLFQAEAEVNQGRFAPAIVLLTARQGDAGALADEYLYWIGEAQYQNTNYTAAADAFSRVAWYFPASARRLAACVGEAAARAKLGEWPRVAELLQKPDSAFQQAAQVKAGDEAVVRGCLLLAEAGLVQNKFAEAGAALRMLENQKLKPELDWYRNYLLCRVRLGENRPADALRGTDDMLKLAESAGRRDLLTESVALQGAIHEQLGDREKAIAAFKRNLTPEASTERQRQALLKVTELTAAQNRLGEAGETLETFLNQFSNAPAADVALLALGELRLKQHVAPAPTNTAPSGTNNLQLALGYFDRLVNDFPSSPLVGKAELDRGWCYWVEGKIPQSLAAFRGAAGRLPPSEDLAVARFKLADALFEQKDFAGALPNYQSALQAGAGWPRVKDALTGQILYQIVRASLGVTNLPAAANAMSNFLQNYPGSDLTDRSVLLVGQGYSDAAMSDKARALCEDFLKQSPDSPMRPEVELVIARTREQQADWPGAMADYEKWLERFGTNELRPRAEFQRAWVNFQARRDTNAFTQFTNFVAQFGTNELAPRAQWWVATYYWNQGDFLNAEKNYKKVFNDWPDSELAYEARMMAGRAAVGRQFYPDAIRHFTNLTSDAKCPRALHTQAVFAYGDVLMNSDTAGTNRLANLQEAIQVLATIPDSNPTNEMAALAWGEIGTCYRQLASQDPQFFTEATNAYQRVLDSPQAGVAARSQAQIGLGLTLEKMAEARTGDEQLALLKLARDNYVDVFHGANLRDGEKSDPFWIKKAGLETVRLLESGPLQDWQQLVKVCERLQKLLPPLSASLEKTKARAKKHLASATTNRAD